MSIISTIEQLEAIYSAPNEASTVKVADRITPPYRVLIDKSPFAALAHCGPEGLDCSPRGDLPGFVRVHDDKTLMMPDRRGNNRVDSLRNIVRDPRIALLFLIPGSGKHPARQRPRGGVGRSGPAGVVSDGWQGAAFGRRHDRGRDLFPVRPCHRPRRAVESGQAGRCPPSAAPPPDSRRNARQTRTQRAVWANLGPA